MRHLRSGRKLNRTASHRKAMLANLAVSILDKERVTTTITKAKEVRSVVERLITYGKKDSLHGIRLAAKSVKNKDILKKLFDDIAPGYKDREGGYTRIMRLNERKGDNAELAIIELVGRNGDDKRNRKKKKKPVAKKAKTVQKSKVKKAEEPQKESIAEEPKKEKSKVEEPKGNKGTVEEAAEKESAVKPKRKTAVKTEKKEQSPEAAKGKEPESKDTEKKKAVEEEEKKTDS